MFTPKKTLELDFAVLEIYDNYFVATIKKNSMVTTELLEQLIRAAKENFPVQKFGYISNRIHRYAVDPTGYFKTSYLPRMEGIAVVCHSDLQKKTAFFEKTFYKNSFEVFDDLQKAHLWMRHLLQENKVSTQPKTTLELDFANLEFYENFLVSTMCEDVVFSHTHLEKMQPIIDAYYKEKKIGYIAHRKNDYNTDPTVYLRSSYHNNIVGMAVVYLSVAQKETALFEKRFYKKPFEVFQNLENAKKWMEKLVTKKAGL